MGIRLSIGYMLMTCLSLGCILKHYSAKVQGFYSQNSVSMFIIIVRSISFSAMTTFLSEDYCSEDILLI